MHRMARTEGLDQIFSILNICPCTGRKSILVFKNYHYINNFFLRRGHLFTFFLNSDSLIFNKFSFLSKCNSIIT